MKTIIISDIKGNGESIIPYGLNLAKFLESNVDIVHVIDPRTEYGVSGSYADSQSIAPGGTLSHSQIMEREKNQAKKALDHLLSREASRLNYPLKINTIVEEESIETKLKTSIADSDSTLIIANSETDGNLFKSQAELISLLRELNSVSLLVPPGHKFNIFENVLITTDFSSEDFENYTQVFDFLNRFNTRVTAIDLKSDSYTDWKLRSQGWLKTARDLMPDLKVSTNVLDHSNDENSMLDYVKKNDPGLVIIFQSRKNFLQRLLHKSPEHKIIEFAEKPVMLYPA